MLPAVSGVLFDSYQDFHGFQGDGPTFQRRAAGRARRGHLPAAPALRALRPPTPLELEMHDPRFTIIGNA